MNEENITGEEVKNRMEGHSFKIGESARQDGKFVALSVGDVVELIFNNCGLGLNDYMVGICNKTANEVLAYAKISLEREGVKNILSLGNKTNKYVIEVLEKNILEEGS